MVVSFFTTDWESSGCLDTTSVSGEKIATLACAPVILSNIISALLALAGFVALVLLIWGGIKYMTAQGDAQKIDGAEKTVTWAIIGPVFIILSFAILAIIKSITGVNF